MLIGNKMEYEKKSKKELIQEIEKLQLELKEKSKQEKEKNKIEIEYRKTQERLKRALDSASIGWWEWDYESGEVLFSDNKATMLGYTVEEFPKNVYEITKLVHPDDYERTMSAMRDHINGKKDLYQIRYRIKTKDGNWKWYYDKGKIIEYNEEGKPKKIIGTVQNITEVVKKEDKIKLQKTQERLKRALNAASIGWWEWDYDSGEVLFSDNKATMLGYTVEDFPKNVYEITKLVHPDDYERTMSAMRDHLTGKKDRYQVRYRIRTKDNNWKWYYDKGKLVEFTEEGKPKKIIGTVQDITEIVKKENKIKLQSENLQRLNGKLEEYNKRLIESNEELRQFAHTIAHDLKNPLNSVISYLSLIERKYEDVLDEDGFELTEMVKNRTKRMMDMINNLLYYAQTVNKGSKFERHNTNTILEKAIENLETVIKEQGAKITSDSLPEIYCDDVQILSLFQNLISNSIKYCDKKTPEIEIRAKGKDEQWLFCIEDNGIGIDTVHKEKIFWIFNRVPSEKDFPKKEGYGIGLSLCKKIVERHQGKIWVESKKGKGSTFYFTIPKQITKQNELNTFSA
jgi:PAS domain S-box-containing protein